MQRTIQGRSLFRGRFAAVALTALAVGASWAGAGAARADAVLEWNVIALQTTGAAPFNPPLETRNLAIVHAAVFDAVAAVARDLRPYALRLSAPAGASPAAAAAAAAHQALVQLYPAAQASLDAAYAASLAGIPLGRSKADGVAVGEAAARRILAMRAGDGAAAAVTAPYTPGGGPGAWAPTPPPLRPALDPGWGAVTPFFLQSGAQFRPGPPPPPGSPRYARDLAEIAALGAQTSATRTPAQTELAQMWVATSPQNWNPIARQVSAARKLGIADNARLFALLNMAGADAFIAAWDAKFTFNQWRPVTAIRAAGADGNPDSAADPAWLPLLVTPPFPDYVAGHTAYAGAAEAVLEHVLGRSPGVTMTLTSASAPGAARTYARFTDIARDVVEARVLGGIHWRTSSARGRDLGLKVGRYAVHGFLRPLAPGHGDPCDGERDDRRGAAAPDDDGAADARGGR